MEFDIQQLNTQSLKSQVNSTAQQPAHNEIITNSGSGIK